MQQTSTDQQLERQADRLIAHHQPQRAEYPAYPEEYLRRKAARHHEVYLEECYHEPEAGYESYPWCEAYDSLPGMVRFLAAVFGLDGELVADILAHDPDAGLPSSWPDVDELKRARIMPKT